MNKTGKTEEAFKEHEELLLSYLNRLQITLNDLRVMYMEQGDLNMAHKLLDKQCILASDFDMGEYQSTAPALDLAAYEKDVTATEKNMRTMIGSTNSIGDFTKSYLFAHLTLKLSDSRFAKKLLSDIIQGFKDEETYGYMRGNPFWDRL